MTYGPGQIISNAAIVPLGPGEQLNVNVSGSTHIVMDVNGYFTDQYNPGVSFHAVSSNAAPAILAENTYGVFGGNGVYGKSVNGYGVYGESTNNNGVAATSAAAAAIWARTTGSLQGVSGVYGSANPPIPPLPAFPPSTFGVYGDSLVDAGSSAGVIGVTARGRISAGTTNPAGVRGESKFGYGVFGLCQLNPTNESTDGVRGAVIAANGNDVVRGILALGSSNSYGVFAGGDYGGTGAKYFVEPHPTDASRVIRYVALEGNEAGTYFRGRGKFQNGMAKIEVPEDFRLVTDSQNLSVVVTPIGEMASFAIVRISLDEIVVKSSRNVEFFYLVNGIRRTHKDLVPIVPGNEYMPESSDAPMPLYLTEGQKQMLISNGTYRPDGTVNMETARGLGWDKQWEKRQQPVARMP
jgi:hypothetical protein